jgi:hypothetical protein
VSHQALFTSLTGQQNRSVQTQKSAAVTTAQQVAGPTPAAASSDSFVFVSQGAPLATELAATIDTMALQSIRGQVDDGSGQALTAGPSQTTLISAAAEFRIAHYNSTDPDEFVFFQS